MSKKATASAQKVPHSRGLEFRMYNERTQQSLKSSYAASQRTQKCRAPLDTARVMRDIPVSEILGNGQTGRRNCDGSLRRDESNMPENGCNGTKCGGWGLEAHPLAMVYSPCQAWRDAYAPDVALDRGTLFSELDLPFNGGSAKRGCN